MIKNNVDFKHGDQVLTIYYETDWTFDKGVNYDLEEGFKLNPKVIEDLVEFSVYDSDGRSVNNLETINEARQFLIRNVIK